MVHVLSCHQFAGDPKMLTPSQDPLTIFSSPTQLFVSTLQHSINVYSLGDGLSEGHGSLQHSFTTAGLVKQGAYSCTGNYIATLEAQGSSQHQMTSIRVYFNWEMSGPRLAVRARVAGGDMQARERGATVSTYNLDRRSGSQFELVEVQTPAPAQCISCCPATGNLAAGIDNTVSVYQFVVQNPGTPNECGDFEWLVQLRVGLMAREVKICEGTVACMGTQELQVVKLRLWDTATREALRGRSVTDTEVVKVHRGKRRVPLLIKPAPSPDNSASDDDEAPASSWKSPADLKTGKSREFCQAQPYFVVDEGAAAGWDFGIEATTMTGGAKASSAQQTAHHSASVLLPSIQSEEPYYESSEENCEMIGPVGRFEGHPSHILFPKKRSRKLKTSLTQLLYRRFVMLSLYEKGDDNKSSLHSLQLVPTYASGSTTMTEASNDLMESSNAQNLAGLCCFFSTSKEGYLYEMQPRPRLLTEYTYKADALQVQAGHSLLFALTQNGLETYTLRTMAAALPNMVAVDNVANTCPPATLDISLVGLEPYLGLTQITVSQNHVMLLSKTREPPSQETPSKSEMTASISSKASTVYIHEQAPLTVIYKSLMELGERYRHTSPTAYLQCMLEGHLLLRMALNLEREGAVTESTDYQSCGSPDDLCSLYLQSCLQLALHYCRGETADWHLTLPYFNMSQLPLQKITELCPKPYTAFEDEEIVTGAGSGMIHYLDWALFEENSTVEADQETADNILKYFVSLGPQHCSKVVLFSKIANRLSPDKALSVLIKVRDTHQPGHHVNFAGIPGRYTWGNLDRLALSEVYLRLGELEQAGTTLCTLSGEEITQLCTRHSSLLLQGEDQFSNLAQLIRQQEPESLLSALVQLIDDSTVSLHTCIKLLRDENESLTSLANSHLKRFLEEVVSTKHRHAVLPGAAELLLEIYFERLKKGMSKGAPLRQSSRHTHIFSGGGCFHKTPEWMDYLPPFQGPESLTFKCLQAASPSNSRPTRGFMGRLQTPILGRLGAGQRSSGPGQSQPSRQAGTDGKAEAEIVCPCCCCNDDLLNIQSLITSTCASPALASQVQELMKAVTVTTPITTTPTSVTPTAATPTVTTATAATPSLVAPAPATATTQSFSQSLQSLDIVCRSVLDPPAILQLLIKDHPGIVLDYAQDNFGKDVTKWKELLNMLLDRGAEMSMVSEGGGDVGGDVSTSSQADYLQILTGVLGHASNLVTPEELLLCLPSEGSLSFFLPYLRQSCCRQHAKMLHQQLVKTLNT